MLFIVLLVSLATLAFQTFIYFKIQDTQDDISDLFQELHRLGYRRRGKK